MDLVIVDAKDESEAQHHTAQAVRFEPSYVLRLGLALL